MCGGHGGVREGAGGDDFLDGARDVVRRGHGGGGRRVGGGVCVREGAGEGEEGEEQGGEDGGEVHLRWF